jgi:hypothetical protein
MGIFSEPSADSRPEQIHMRPDWSVYGWSIDIRREGCQQKIA